MSFTPLAELEMMSFFPRVQSTSSCKFRWSHSHKDYMSKSQTKLRCQYL